MIGAFEGYRRWPYNDAAGHATIGYGHLLHLGNVTARDRARYPLGLTRGPALRLLRRDCAAAESAVKRYVRRGLKQQAYDALVSFTFNCGGGALAHSTLLRDVNRPLGEVTADKIRADFRSWSHAGGMELPGLVRRRLAEAELYLAGKYPQNV